MTDAIRPLIAGNWKMNGLKASMADSRPCCAGARRGRRQGRSAGLPAGDPDRRLRRKGARLKGPRGRRAGLPPQGLGRPYRRSFGGNAGGCRRQRHHCRPFRAARRSWRERRAGAAEGRGRLARRPAPPSSASARPSISAMPARRSISARGQLTGSLPDGATPSNLVVAYEPVWAIGTGLTPTAGDVEQIHRLYPGSPDRRDLTARGPGFGSSMAAR